MYSHLLNHDLGDIADIDKSAVGIVGNEDFYPYVFLDLFIEKE